MELINDRLLIGGMVTENLIEKYGSPLFVYEASRIRERYLKLKECIHYPKLKIYYSCKANSSVAIMQILRKLGASVQVSSPAEIYLALKAGFSSFNIFHASSNAGMSEMSYVVDRNINIGIDSLSLLKQYGERYRGSQVSLRLNPELTVPETGEGAKKSGPDDVVPMRPIPSKTGIPVSSIETVKKILAEYRLTVRGLHVHLCAESRAGTYVVDFLGSILEWAEVFESVEMCNIGGGVGSLIEADEDEDSLEHLSESIVKRLQQFTSKTSRTLTLAIEPGRFLVGDSGYLISTVNSLDSDGTYTYAGLDTGINHLFRHQIDRDDYPVYKASRQSNDLKPYLLSGNLNEELDVFYRYDGVYKTRELPQLAIGDLLVFARVGAYGFSMASPYCGRLLPAEVLIDSGRDQLIRRRQSFEDVFRDQIY